MGLLLQGVGYEYQHEILSGASSECEREDVDLICFAGGDIGRGAIDCHNVIYRLATPDSVDGLVVAAGSMSQTKDSTEYSRLRERLEPVPMVGLAAELENTPSIMVDNYTSVRQLTEHLIDAHGRRRLVFIEGIGPESDTRRNGFVDAMRNRGLQVDPGLRHRCDFLEDGASELVNDWLRTNTALPDAIVAANDWMALGAIRTLARRGVRVPDDVSVIGFDDVDEARFRIPALTTVRQPSWNLGALGVRSVLRALAGQPLEPLLLLPTLPRIRRSCGCREETTRDILDRESIHPSQRAEHRTACARLFEASAPNTGNALPDDWPDRLADALALDLECGSQSEFAGMLEHYVATTAYLGNVSAWHGLVTSISVATAGAHPERDSTRQVEAIARIRERGHIVVGAQAERLQGERRLWKEDILRRLSTMSGSVRSAMNHDELREALLIHLPGLGVGRAFVAWNTKNLDPGSTTELLMGYEHDVGELPQSRGCQFRTGDLIPRHLETSRRTTMVALPASYKNSDALGFSLMEFTAIDGSVYESLREQLSVALKGTQLLRTLVQEATLRGQAERARLEGELGIARRIQSAVLPQCLDVVGLDIATLMVPAADVGGDYFDVLPFPDGTWLSIGDVAGHGLQAGLEMIMLQSMIATLVQGRPSADPLEVWHRVNSVLTHNTRSRLETNDHVTLSILRYTADGSIVGVGAHEDIIIHRARTGRCEFVPTPGLWAGAMAEPEPSVIQCYAFRLEPGDTMVLYTDGLTEAMNAARELFGLERVGREIEAHHGLPPRELCQHLYDVAADWAVTRDDDLSLIVARYDCA